MIADGLIERFPVDEVYGMHNMPGLPVGHFAMRTGPMMASEALFEISVVGQGGHAAMPHKGADAIVVGAEIVTALQTIVSRKLDPGRNGVVSVTDFRTDGQRNILPGKAVLTGDARALTAEANVAIEARMRRIVEGVCLAHGVTGTVSYDTIFEVLVNAPEPTARAAEAARAVAGTVDTDCAPILGSEDFGPLGRRTARLFRLRRQWRRGSECQTAPFGRVRFQRRPVDARCRVLGAPGRAGAAGDGDVNVRRPHGRVGAAEWKRRTSIWRSSPMTTPSIICAAITITCTWSSAGRRFC